ncbi:MAG TPA: hypothetical protein VN549_03705 [Negativicutes bacterium]|nr:hypothetical protein [Negativicutes bacterium]
MPDKEAPKGSFKTGSGKWFISCWECKSGINGNCSCSCGMKAKQLKVGCFKGRLLDKFSCEEGDKGVR